MLYLTNESKKTKLVPQEKLKYWHFYQDLNTFLKQRCKDDQKLSQSILCQLPRDYTQKYYQERRLDVINNVANEERKVAPASSLNQSVRDDVNTNASLPNVGTLDNLEESKDEQDRSPSMNNDQANTG